MDSEGKRAARQSISAIKVVAANMVMNVLDRAIQIHGALGMTDDTPIAALWRFSRTLRLATAPTRSTRWSSPVASSTAGLQHGHDEFGPGRFGPGRSSPGS
jgi:hypothetical protein